MNITVLSRTKKRQKLSFKKFIFISFLMLLNCWGAEYTLIYTKFGSFCYLDNPKYSPSVASCYNPDFLSQKFYLKPYFFLFFCFYYSKKHTTASICYLIFLRSCLQAEIGIWLDLYFKNPKFLLVISLKKLKYAGKTQRVNYQSIFCV